MRESLELGGHMSSVLLTCILMVGKLDTKNHSGWEMIQLWMVLVLYVNFPILYKKNKKLCTGDTGAPGDWEKLEGKTNLYVELKLDMNL